jgi:hypothetical protein
MINWYWLKCRNRSKDDIISQWKYLCCKLNLPDIFASIEIPHRQTNKLKILAAVGVLLSRYSILKLFMDRVSRYLRIIYINFFMQLIEYFTRRLLESLWSLLIELRSPLISMSFGTLGSINIHSNQLITIKIFNLSIASNFISVENNRLYKILFQQIYYKCTCRSSIRW